MPVLRRFLLVLMALSAVAGFASSRALAAGTLPSCPPDRSQFPRVISSTHFEVYYTDDPAGSGPISQVQAGTVLAAAERSYASDVAAGFPTPAVMLASGRTELYIMDLTSFSLAGLYCTGSVYEDTGTVTGNNMAFSVGQDVFTETAIATSTNIPTWMLNGTSAWASWKALGYPADSISDIGPFDMSLDCASAYDKINCAAHGYENLGASRWPFYEYLTEKYGPLFLIDVFSATGAASGNGLVGIENALIAKGTTLSDEYGAYAAKLLTGGWTATTLSAAIIPVSGTAIQTGISSGAIPSQSFGINHLATKFVEIDRGNGAGDHPCYAATLTMNVAIPAGVTSQPTFYWSGGGSAPVSLTVNGGTATTTVPWDTCAWSTKGYLALPNTSLVDGKSFAVSGTLNVDFLTPATAALPPAPSSQFGQAIPASSFSTAPTLSLFGPQLLHIDAQATQLRLIVDSTGEGSVTAQIGSVVLGTASVRPGGNDLRFALPASLLQTYRSLTADGLTLTLTPLAPDGKTAGTALTRTIAVTGATRGKSTTKAPKKHTKAKKPAAKKPVKHTTKKKTKS